MAVFNSKLFVYQRVVYLLLYHPRFRWHNLRPGVQSRSKFREHSSFLLVETIFFFQIATYDL